MTRPAVGVAVAASVAVMALLGIRQIYAPGDSKIIDGDFAGRFVPDSQNVSVQPDDELLKQFYLHHNPRLVTWQPPSGQAIRPAPQRRVQAARKVKIR